ncbi:MAG: TraR/DksA C4-type zinc finger protein [Candidatus Hodarchaeota archaeon]
MDLYTPLTLFLGFVLLLFVILTIFALAMYIGNEAEKYGRNRLFWSLIVFVIFPLGVLAYLSVQASWHRSSPPSPGILSTLHEEDSSLSSQRFSDYKDSTSNKLETGIYVLTILLLVLLGMRSGIQFMLGVLAISLSLGNLVNDPLLNVNLLFGSIFAVSSLLYFCAMIGTARRQKWAIGLVIIIAILDLILLITGLNVSFYRLTSPGGEAIYDLILIGMAFLEYQIFLKYPPIKQKPLRLLLIDLLKFISGQKPQEAETSYFIICSACGERIIDPRKVIDPDATFCPVCEAELSE